MVNGGATGNHGVKKPQEKYSLNFLDKPDQNNEKIPIFSDQQTTARLIESMPMIGTIYPKVFWEKNYIINLLLP